MASPSFPILVVAPPTLSEAVLFSGLVKRLAEEVPHARFTVLGDPAVTGVYRDLPGLDKTIALEPAALGLHWLKLWPRLSRRRWGLVLDMTGTRLARGLKARRKAIRKPLSAALDPVHKVVEAAQILRIDDDPPAPFLYVGPETEAAAEALLRPPAGAKDGPILALAPAADWVGKTWPAERFAVVAAELLSPRGPLSGGRLMVVGRQEDRWAAEAVRRAIARDRLIDLAGRADMVTTYACLKRVRLFIGGESEMLHLAAAAGAPTLGLFGPSDERVWRPWGPLGEALRGPRDFDAIKASDPGLSQAVCHMQDLPVAWVVNAARRLLDATEAREAAAEEASDA
jgi:ADP-heptose:LPS heptosyltransferase